MPRLIFTDDFSYKPVPQQTFVYKKGDVALVTQAIADKALSDGKAKTTELDAPPSGIENTIRKYPRKKKATKAEDILNEYSPSKAGDE